jgi:hypothetical protein
VVGNGPRAALALGAWATPARRAAWSSGRSAWQVIGRPVDVWVVLGPERNLGDPGGLYASYLLKTHGR